MVIKAKYLDFEAINARILNLMKVHGGMSRYRLAKEMSVAESSVSKNFAGKTNWGLDSIAKIAGIFNVSIDYLVTGIEHDTNKALRDEIEKLTIDNQRLKETAIKLKNVITILNEESLNEPDRIPAKGKQQT